MCLQTFDVCRHVYCPYMCLETFNVSSCFLSVNVSGNMQCLPTCLLTVNVSGNIACFQIFPYRKCVWKHSMFPDMFPARIYTVYNQCLQTNFQIFSWRECQFVSGLVTELETYRQFQETYRKHTVTNPETVINS